MRNDVLAAIEQNHLVDISTIGRTSGRIHRHEIWLHIVDQECYLIGKPAPRDWLANLRANPQVTVHIKHGLQQDIPASSTPITNSEERHKILTAILHETPYWNNREAWLLDSPLVRIDLHINVIGDSVTTV